MNHGHIRIQSKYKYNDLLIISTSTKINSVYYIHKIYKIMIKCGIKT